MRPTALVGFLGVLRQNIAEGKTPNVDWILGTMTCSQTVSFLRMCQAQPPTSDVDAVKGELPNLIRRLELNFLRDERTRLKKELRIAFQQKQPETVNLQKQLRLVQQQLTEKQALSPEGGN